MNELNEQLEHVKELWDKLDPRDRDLLMRNSLYKIDTLCDWRALSKEEQQNIFRWCYP